MATPPFLSNMKPGAGKPPVSKGKKMGKKPPSFGFGKKA